MKYLEFKKWLKKKGCKFSTDGKGSHRTVYYKNRKTILPFHGGKEIGEGLRKTIIKQLGIK